ncbi:MAG TPA: hypothetical protein VKO45_09060, partial [Methanomicrobiales archaeon]|nr:hypothetical protein [Methanomicrobiales archaeon]
MADDLFQHLPDPVWGAPLVSSPSQINKESLFPSADPALTVVAAQDSLRECMDDGSKCPCCGRPVQWSPIPLGAGKAVTLIRMMRYHDLHKVDWIHMLRDVNNFGLPSRDYGSLEYWGFVEPKGVAKEDGNPDSGFWRLTQKGRAFAMGLSKCPFRA